MLQFLYKSSRQRVVEKVRFAESGKNYEEKVQRYNSIINSRLEKIERAMLHIALAINHDMNDKYDAAYPLYQEAVSIGFNHEKLEKIYSLHSKSILNELAGNLDANYLSMRLFIEANRTKPEFNSWPKSLQRIHIVLLAVMFFTSLQGRIDKYLDDELDRILTAIKTNELHLSAVQLREIYFYFHRLMYGLFLINEHDDVLNLITFIKSYKVFNEINFKMMDLLPELHFRSYYGEADVLRRSDFSTIRLDVFLQYWQAEILAHKGCLEEAFSHCVGAFNNDNNAKLQHLRLITYVIFIFFGVTNALEKKLITDKHINQLEDMGAFVIPLLGDEDEFDAAVKRRLLFLTTILLLGLWVYFLVDWNFAIVERINKILRPIVFDRNFDFSVYHEYLSPKEILKHQEILGMFKSAYHWAALLEKITSEISNIGSNMLLADNNITLLLKRYEISESDCQKIICFLKFTIGGDKPSLQARLENWQQCLPLFEQLSKRFEQPFLLEILYVYQELFKLTQIMEQNNNWLDGSVHYEPSPQYARHYEREFHYYFFKAASSVSKREIPQALHYINESVTRSKSVPSHNENQRKHLNEFLSIIYGFRISIAYLAGNARLVKSYFYDYIGINPNTSSILNFRSQLIRKHKEKYCVALLEVHHAASTGNLGAFTRAVTVSNVNMMTPDMRTPLLCAVQARHGQIIDYLLKNHSPATHLAMIAADDSFKRIHFRTALSYAKHYKQLDIIALLILYRTAPSSKEFEDLLSFHVDTYRAALHEIEKHTTVEMFTSHLVQMDVMPLFFEDYCHVKMFGHSTNIVGTLASVALEFFDSKRYFPYRIRLLCQFLIDCSVNAISLFGDEIELIKQEIQIAVEIVMILRLYRLLEKVNKWCNKSIFEKIFNNFVENLSQSVYKLQKNREYCLPVCYAKHLIYVSFCKVNDTFFLVRIDNLAPINTKHTFDMNDADKVYPYCFPIRYNAIKKYIAGLVHACISELNQDTSDRIYLLPKEDNFALPSTKLQTTNNCTKVGHDVGMEIRLGYKLYNMYIEYEKNLIIILAERHGLSKRPPMEQNVQRNGPSQKLDPYQLYTSYALQTLFTTEVRKFQLHTRSDKLAQETTRSSNRTPWAKL